MGVATQIRMANEIAAQFRYLPAERAADAVATHLRTFWEPRMRGQLLEYAAAGGPGLDPLVIEAASRFS
jgi:formate dehydrogenase subunit delta